MKSLRFQAFVTCYDWCLASDTMVKHFAKPMK